jgi:hypothetical protein
MTYRNFKVSLLKNNIIFRQKKFLKKYTKAGKKSFSLVPYDAI